jgi:hypothetical protein
LEASGLKESVIGYCQGENYGDLPAPFIFKAPETINEDSLTNSASLASLTFVVGDLEIVVPAKTATKLGEGNYTYTHHSKIQWDSKTGIVSADVDGVRKAVLYTGNSLGGIPSGDELSWGIKSGDKKLSHSGCSLDYHYWYY